MTISGKTLLQSVNQGKLKKSDYGPCLLASNASGVKHPVMDEIGTENYSVGPLTQSGLMPSCFLRFKGPGSFKKTETYRLIPLTPPPPPAIRQYL
jgi:hypothetical protein